MIEVHPESGQTIEEFAFDLHWVAKRTERFRSHVFGRFNGVFLIALPESNPSEIAQDYWRKERRQHEQLS